MELLPNSACQRLSKLELECTFGKTKEGQSALGQVHCRIQFSSVWTLSRIQLFVTPWTAARQASLSINNSQSLLKLMSIQLVMPSNHLILCCPLLFLPSIFPNIRAFANGSVLCIRWPKYWSFNFTISPSNKYSGLISFRIDCVLISSLIFTDL